MSTGIPPQPDRNGRAGPERRPSHYPPPPPPAPGQFTPPQYTPPGSYLRPGYRPSGSPQPAYSMASGAQQRPPQYWGLSIAALVLFLVVGAVGLYFSAQVNSRWSVGNYAGALKASKTALVLDIIGIVLGIFFWISLITTLNSNYYS